MHAHDRAPDREEKKARVPRRDPAELSTPRALLALQRLVGNATVTSLVQRAAVDNVLRSSGEPIDERVRTDMEHRLGADFSDVRVHTGSAADSAARSVGADAFTSGSHIAFRQGRYDTTSSAGRHMLAHELTHVVQQRSGPVSGTDHGTGLKVSDPSDSFERAAEVNATRVMNGGPTSQRDSEAAEPNSADPEVVQRAVGAEVEDSHWTVVDGWGKPVRKGTVLVHRPLFQLQAEYAGAKRSNIEMVSNPPGALNRGEWNATRDGMTNLGNDLISRKDDGPFPTSRLEGGVGGFQLVPGDRFKPFLQVTAGVPLAAVPELYTRLRAVGATVGVQSPLPTAQATQQTLGLAGPPTGELFGFITLLDNYLRQGAPDRWKTFLKALFPVMARTDFAAMFGMLPVAERTAIATNLDAWVRLLAGAQQGLDDPTGDGRLLAGWFDDPQDPARAMEITTTRREWLTSMVQGSDLLTAHGKVGPGAPFMTDLEQARQLAVGVRQDVNPKKLNVLPTTHPDTQPIPEGELRRLLEDLRELYAGLGALRSRTDQVRYDNANAATPAIIVEIRNPDETTPWARSMDDIYDAVELAIHNSRTLVAGVPQGNLDPQTGQPMYPGYTNEMTPAQAGLRQQAQDDLDAATVPRPDKSLGEKVVVGTKALVRATRALKPAKQ